MILFPYFIVMFLLLFIIISGTKTTKIQIAISIKYHKKIPFLLNPGYCKTHLDFFRFEFENSFRTLQLSVYCYTEYTVAEIYPFYMAQPVI